MLQPLVVVAHLLNVVVFAFSHFCTPLLGIYLKLYFVSRQFYSLKSRGRRDHYYLVFIIVI